MIANLYIGKHSWKTHLEVAGVTLATEGDVCRDELARSEGVDLWTTTAMAKAARIINQTAHKKE